MHHKDVKLAVRKQLKKQFPNWKRLSRKVKNELAMGFDIKLITADEAYHDKDGTLFRETEVIVTTPPSAKISIPQHVDKDSGAVFCHDSCDIAMHRAGFENQTH